MREPLYELQQVRQVYARREVLHIGQLHVLPGEILAVVGPSGAGKSTLLRLLNFLEHPSDGTITFDGVTYRPEEKVPTGTRRRITTVFQQPYLFNRSVSANVRFGLRLRGGSDSHAQVDDILRWLGIRQLASQSARTLSGGEAQRVALARALVIRPDVLLLDEPTANLDPHNVGLIEEAILQYNREQGATVVMVTHNVFQARRLAQRVALLLEGSIVELNDVDTFFGKPADLRTAAFIEGKMVY